MFFAPRLANSVGWHGVFGVMLCLSWLDGLLFAFMRSTATSKSDD